MLKIVMNYIFCLAVVCTIAMSGGAAAFAQQEQPDLTIDAATRTQVIDGILKRLNDSYVFPDIAKKMEQSIRERVEERIRSDHELEGICDKAHE